MSSLEINYTSSVNYSAFVNELASIITNNDFMSIVSYGNSPTNIRDIKGGNLGISGTSYSYKYLAFKNFCTDASTFCLLITASSYPTNSINCIPMCTLAAFYNDENKTFTKVNYSGDNSIYSNFRVMKYTDSKTNFLSLGKPGDSMTVSTHIFKSIDDPTNIKTVFAVTDKDGYVSFYDSYTPYPWYVENIYHNGNNIGHTSSINAYKLSIKGYYCDNLYYFDGGYTIPGESVSTIGGIKFLKLGDNNIFIKME